ncbi:MAG: DEAD/DEAH box helicase [Patescibacteria group bacterium]|nr:DEAD/DEAH box helicase [Patescibacteria group bacterium]MDD4610430.1 DEAD/DEAH box helicase [Patescibacteria group bacterium]
MDKLKKFRDLGLSENSLEALRIKGFEEPSPIQSRCIPLLMENKIDLVGQAQTGTGKTAAFGLPIIEKTDENLRQVQALIIVPTRELAIQVCEELNSLKGAKKLLIAPIYGGQAIYHQLVRLGYGTQIIVGTPGRINDFIRRKKLILNNLKFLVLDEADEMLNMGFIDDIETIIDATPKEKRMLLFSATMPSRILGLVRKYMTKYELIQVKQEKITTDLTEQLFFEVYAEHKLESLVRIIDIEPDFYGLIFCRTRAEVDMVAGQLINRGYKAEGIHGDIAQTQREKTFDKFKKKKINILVATDVAARGISVSNLSHVVNYSLPEDPDCYVHRIGRTGRAGQKGTAINLIAPFEYRKLIFMQRNTNAQLKKGKLPNVQEVIKKKKEKIINDVEQIMAADEHKNFEKISKELIKEHDPKKIIAALLRYSFQKDLEESSYSQIPEVIFKPVSNFKPQKLYPRTNYPYRNKFRPAQRRYARSTR